MPTAPLVRLQMNVMDDPQHPFMFESFLNVTEETQANVLAELTGQDKLFLAFHGDNLTHRFTTAVQHDEQQWQLLDVLAEEATQYWEQLPEHVRDYDLAKAMFLSGHM